MALFVNTLPRIAIDYTAAIHQTAGIGRYVRELVRALADLRPAADVRLFVAGTQENDLPGWPGGFTYRLTRLSDLTLARLWHKARVPVPVETWTGRVDLFHATDFTLPPLLPGTHSVLTVFDLSFARYPNLTMPGMQRYLTRVVLRSACRADRVIAISEATKADLCDLYSIDPRRISVVYPGVEPRFHPAEEPAAERAVRARYGLGDGPFILTVGTLQPRKNHARLVEAFARIGPRYRLVIAGGRGWAYQEVSERVAQLGLDDRVIFPGYVDDADLPGLYRAASALAYPSLYEGFGLPVLEAMACGTPVMAADTSSLPEVVGEAGLLVDPLDVDALAGALVRLLEDEPLRARLREQGIRQAADFTWARAAAETWEIYRSTGTISVGW